MLAAAVPAAAGADTPVPPPASTTTVTGTYEPLQVDPPVEPAAAAAPGARTPEPPVDAVQDFVRLPDGEHVRVEAEPALLDGIVPGQRVAVTGTSESSESSESSDDARDGPPSIEATAVRALAEPEAPRTADEDTVAVVLLRLGDTGPAPVSVEDMRRLVFTAPNSVAAFYRESSWSQLELRGRDRADGDVYDYLTIPADTACWDEDQAGLAAAKAAGLDLAGYDRVVFALDSADRYCSGSGWAWLGGQVAVSFLYDEDSTRAIVQHELGHTLGLSHASALRCATPDGRPTPVEEEGGWCDIDEYRDPFDSMGSSFNQMQFSARHKAQLGWIPASNVTTVTESGSYTIAPSEVRTDEPQLVRIPLPSGLAFDIDVRRPYGQYWDAKVADYPALMNGVTIRRGHPTSMASLVDTTPGGWVVDDAPLQLGQTFTDPVSGVSVRTESVGPEGAVVHVELGAVAQEVYLTGTHNAWTPTLMTPVAGAPSAWTAQIEAGGEPDQRFRFDVRPGGVSYGDVERDGVADPQGPDIPVTEPGTYTVTFDAATLRYTVVRAGSGWASTYPTMTMQGTSTEWGSLPLELVGDHTWRVTTAFGAHPVEELRFDVDGTGTTRFGDAEPDGVAEPGGPDIPMTQGPAIYEVTFHDDTLTYSIVRTW